MRCAICFIPPADDALTLAGGRWLRRDPYSGAKISSTIEGLIDEDHAFLTALPRRHGFHGTLKAPFRLLEGRSIQELGDRLDRFCTRLEPIEIDIRIALVDSFFAIVPCATEPELDSLAARLVTEFDGFRSPLTEIDLARRDVSRLNSRQLSNLMTWGCPNVFDQFRFHMTLTGHIDHLERDHVALVLARHFGHLAAGPIEIAQIGLFVEPEPNAPFVVHSTHRFSPQRQFKTA